MQPTDRTTLQPNPITTGPGPWARPALFSELAHAVRENARALGTPDWPDTTPTGPIVGSGHQPWLWHPGILIKDHAAGGAAANQSGLSFHIVVDHDEHPATSLPVPVQRGRLLSTIDLILGKEKPGLSSIDQPPIDLSNAAAAVEQMMRDEPSTGVLLPRLRDGLLQAHRHLNADPDRAPSLAHQMTAVLDRLRRNVGVQLPVVFASQLARMSAFTSTVERMLADPVGCAEAYNRAVGTDPDAGIAQLAIAPGRVELPLWIMHTKKPGPRVKAFAQAQAGRWHACDVAGNRFDPNSQRLMPRALTMTAILRSAACHLFVHGKGGGRYDRITEAWWKSWTGLDPAPMAVASADVFLRFNVPSATSADVVHATWVRHHFNHNADRLRPRGSDLVIAKGHALAQMAQASDKAEKARLFQEIHLLNQSLVAESPDLTDRLDQKLADAKDGVLNRAILARRDWCFAFYEPDRLRALMG